MGQKGAKLSGKTLAVLEEIVLPETEQYKSLLDNISSVTTEKDNPSTSTGCRVDDLCTELYEALLDKKALAPMFLPKVYVLNNEYKLPREELYDCIREACRLFVEKMIRQNSPDPPSLSIGISQIKSDDVASIGDDELRSYLHNQIDSLPVGTIRSLLGQIQHGQLLAKSIEVHKQTVSQQLRQRLHTAEEEEDRLFLAQQLNNRQVQQANLEGLLMSNVQGRIWTKQQQHFLRVCLEHSRPLLNSEEGEEQDSKELQSSKHVFVDEKTKARVRLARCSNRDPQATTAGYLPCFMQDSMQVFAPLLFCVRGKTHSVFATVDVPQRRSGPKRSKTATLDTVTDTNYTTKSKFHSMVIQWYSAAEGVSEAKRLDTTFDSDEAALRYLLQRINDTAPNIDPKLHELFDGSDFFRHLTSLFDTAQEACHGLAVRLLWIALNDISADTASAKFTQYCNFLCCGERFNAYIRNAMFSILLGDASHITSHLDEEIVVSFYAPVIHKGIWPGLLAALSNSPLDERLIALKDIHTLLHNNSKNVAVITKLKNWVRHILALLTDIPKSKCTQVNVAKENMNNVGRDRLQTIKQSTTIRGRDRARAVSVVNSTERTVYASAVGLIVQVLFEEFFTQRFPGLLAHVVSQVTGFGGYTYETRSVCQLILQALCNRIKAGRKRFLHNYQSAEWTNLAHLNEHVRCFMFQNARWGQETTVVDGGAKLSIVSADEKHSQEELAQGFLLYRYRQHVPTLHFVENKDIDMKDYGVHFDLDGSWHGESLAVAVLYAFKALGLTQSSLTDSMIYSDKEEKEYITAMSPHYFFWQEALHIGQLINARQVEVSSEWTFRKVSVTVKDLLKYRLKPKERERVKASVEASFA